MRETSDDHPCHGRLFPGRPGVVRNLRVDPNDGAGLDGLGKQRSLGRTAPITTEEVISDAPLDREQDLLSSVMHESVFLGRIEADQRQLLQVFVVLFENAILAGATEVEASWVDDKDTVRITVADNGPGVPDAVRDRLFEPFVTSRKRDESKPGTGLGLALVAKLVGDHGGVVDLESDDRGAAFKVMLPVDLSSEGQEQ